MHYVSAYLQSVNDYTSGANVDLYPMLAHNTRGHAGIDGD